MGQNPGLCEMLEPTEAFLNTNSLQGGAHFCRSSFSLTPGVMYKGASASEPLFRIWKDRTKRVAGPYGNQCASLERSPSWPGEENQRIVLQWCVTCALEGLAFTIGGTWKESTGLGVLISSGDSALVGGIPREEFWLFLRCSTCEQVYECKEWHQLILHWFRNSMYIIMIIHFFFLISLRCHVGIALYVLCFLWLADHRYN